MSSEWDEYASDWDSSEDVVSYSENAFQSLCEIVSPDGLNVLDFGCGTGSLTEKLAQHANGVVALDTSPAMLAVLEGKSLSNVVTIGEELSDELLLKNALLQPEFNLIVASSVCGFLSDYEGTLRLLKSLLVHGGWFVQWDWQATKDEHETGLTKEAVLSALGAAGFRKELVSTPFSMASPKGPMDVLMGVGQNP